MSELSIEEVALAFTDWRTQRKTRSTTPENLKSMATSLLAKHSMNEICKRLSVNSGMLKAWGGLKKLIQFLLPKILLQSFMKRKHLIRMRSSCH